MSDLSSAGISKVFKENLDEAGLWLCRVISPDASFPTIYLVSNTENVVSKAITYYAFPFEITLSPQDDDSERQISATFDNVSLELIDELRSQTTPLRVEFDLVFSNDLDSPEISIKDLRLISINYNARTISAQLIYDDILSAGFPSYKYGPTTFKGLFK